MVLYIQVYYLPKKTSQGAKVPGIDHVYVAQTKDKGWGLFAKETLVQGSVIGYAGEICNILDLEGKNLIRGKANPYCISCNDRYIVDGETNGGIGRFANCDETYPNTNASVHYAHGVPVVLLVARRPIFKDEEITWNYGASSQTIIGNNHDIDKSKLDYLWGKNSADIIQHLKTETIQLDSVISFLKSILSEIKC